MMLLQRDSPALILASGSASRRALLSAAGLRFDVRPASIDEAAIKASARSAGADAPTAASRLADAKAAHISSSEPDALVIGADQILVCGESWFDKPADMPAARDQLRALRGKPHVLETAVVAWRGGAQRWRHLARPRLTMRSFSDRFLDAYLAAEGDSVLGSVGAYRLEGLGAHLFQHVAGDHAAILGMPLLPLLEHLRASGLLLG